jgi:hypothetical protein
MWGRGIGSLACLLSRTQSVRVRPPQLHGTRLSFAILPGFFCWKDNLRRARHNISHNSWSLVAGASRTVASLVRKAYRRAAGKIADNLGGLLNRLWSWSVRLTPLLPPKKAAELV